MKISSKIILFALLFLPHTIISQYKDLTFVNFSRDEGLSVSAISGVLQDRDGFIWFGTNSGGINRYDGYGFKIYFNVTGRSGSLNYSWIRALYEDKNGILWIGTMGEGLSRFDKDNEKFENFYNNPDDPNTLGGNTVHSVYMDSSGYLWLGFETYGLDKFDVKSNKFFHFRNNVNDSGSISGETVWAIYEDRAGNLWIGTDKGLERFERKSEKFFHYRNFPDKKEKVSNNAVQCIYEDNTGMLWLGTTNGLNKVKYSKNEIIFLKTYYFTDDINGSNISSIHQDSNSFFWIGTYGEGLIILNPITEEFTRSINNEKEPASLRSNRIERNSIIEDRSGNIWIGTSFGISMYSKNNFLFYPFREPTANFTFFEDREGRLWLTGNNNFHVRGKDGNFKIIPYELPIHQISASGWLYQGIYDRSGVIWLGYRSGLYKYNEETGKLSLFFTFLDEYNLPTPAVHAIFEDSDSLLWIGTSKGVWLFDKDRTIQRKFVHDYNDPNSINSDYTYIHIYEDLSGGIWITLWYNGVDKYDKKTGKFIHYKNNPSDSNSIGSNTVSSLYDDGQGSMWIAACAGLDRLDLKTNTFSHFTEKDGLADNYTLTVLPDKSGSLWVATNSGISKFNPVNKTFKNYDKGDGLQGIEFSDIAYKTGKGEMFFFGLNGINYFYPDSIKENNHIPPVYITSFKVFGKEIVLDKSIVKTEEIKLSYKDNFFAFEFAALDYTNPKKNRYKYMLEGVDNEWRNSGNMRSANYTDIDPGEYIFRVKGSNNDGVWNEKGASIRIIITPPWWQTWWFRGCGVLLIAGVIGLTFNRRLHAVKKEKIAQEEFTRQLISAHEDERKRIAGELHDSLGQNLLIIKNKTILGKKNPEKNPVIIDEISDLSSSTLQEVREISYNLHPYQLERLGLTKAIESITERALKSTNIKFKDELDIIDKIFNSEIEINIYRIIQECVNNIIKHSGATEAKLIIKKKQDKVTITISDNGKGFDINTVLSDKSKRGIGLMDINERAKLFNGLVEFKSAPGKGTNVNIIIPVK